MGETKPKRLRGLPPFYAQVLSEAEALRLPQAEEVEGLDEEIALLRVKLASLLEAQPQNMELVIKGVELLVKATATRYRLSKKSANDLLESITGVLEGVGSVLGLEGF